MNFSYASQALLIIFFLTTKNGMKMALYLSAIFAAEVAVKAVLPKNFKGSPVDIC